MRTIRRPVTASCLATLLAGSAGIAAAQSVAIDNDDIGGIVTGPAGPEAGVWVIAETDDFETRYAKIVVTDDQGRYVVPDLPPADYQVWVRGYGLVDSAKVAGRPGQDAESHRQDGAVAGRGSRRVSRRVLVLDDEGAGSEPRSARYRAASINISRR